MKRITVPLLFIFLFLLESLFVDIIPPEVFNSGRVMVPRFLMAAIFFLTVYGNAKQGVIYGLIFGLLFDMVYTEILGVYLVLFPLLSYLFANVMRILQTNVVVVSAVSLIGIALLEVGVYEMNLLIHITNMDFSNFVSVRLFPTLVLNMAFLVLAAYPFKRQFEKFADFLRND
ncbi:rod shape-determining protein MreD [Mesobacillus zeae]|uniref:Rod shape-determining protein MreD n=1 Tax=Mesobacillus zeae TaxID=1917180 RepID=A0A398B5R7_9BACI|nr:rod shape-determining protein MreD [Mesobacillus zeae]RID83280.1 rod shape-determining protein MreD [Mesobacillus zeae]